MSDAPRYPDTDGKSLDNQVRELKDYIINLHRYIRYAINNIDVRNMTLSTAASVRKIGDIDTSVSEIMQDMDRISLSVTTKDGKVSLELNGAGGGGGTIDLTGMVTFENLAVSDGKTVINADNITTGKISAVDIEGVNITGSVFKSNNGIDTSPNFQQLTIDEDVLSFSNLDMYGGVFQWGADYDIEGIWFKNGYNHYNFAGVNIDTSRKLNIYADNGVNITGSSITLNGAEPLTESSVVPIANGGTGATTANAAANNLCEYGTWTPKMQWATNTETPTVTYQSQIGEYVRIGNIVHAWWKLRFKTSSGWTTNGDYLRIAGFPHVFANNNNQGFLGTIVVPGSTLSAGYYVQTYSGYSHVGVQSQNGMALKLTKSNTGDFYFYGQLTYKI